MSTMASEITSVLIVYSTICSGADQKKTSKLHITGLCEGNLPLNCEFSVQRASNAEIVPIQWHHHEFQPFITPVPANLDQVIVPIVA